MLVAYLGLRFGYQPGFVTAGCWWLVPVFVTGGIHVDGLLDTSDALSSWQERSRRLEILKDSHAGAFAVITAAVYFIAWYGAYSQLFNSAENMRAIGILSLVLWFPDVCQESELLPFRKQRQTVQLLSFPEILQMCSREMC